MSTKYKFPCQKCGFIFELGTTQAGQDLTCSSCGDVVEAPKLGVLKTLPVVGGTESLKKSKKVGNHIATTIGLSIALLFGMMGGGLYYYSTTLVTDLDIEGELKEFNENVDAAKPEVIVAMFSQLKSDQGLGEWREQSVVRYNKQGAILKTFAFVLMAISGIGLLVFFFSK
ncbi:MAG: hypothetical protein AAF939_06990 [Planctomycetota bacterium]